MLRRLARLLLRKLLLSEHGPSRIIRGPARGMQMYGATLSNILSLTEPHLQRIILRHVQANTTVLDIGANTGFFTMMMARQSGQGGRVFAFEAIPSTFGILQQNIDVNHLTTVTACHTAVSNGQAELVFRVPTGAPSMASYHWHKDEPDVDTVKVGSMPLDTFGPLRGLTVSFVKIDVEGAEGDVIEGMQGILAESRPVIFIECSDIGRQKVWSTLSALGYACYRAMATSRQVTAFEDFRHADFLWLPMKASS